MKYKFFIVMLLSAGFLHKAKAQKVDSVYRFNLEQAVDYALTHQTAIINANADVEIAKNTVKETIGIGLPQINSTFNFQDFLKVPVSLVPGEFFGQPAGTLIPVQFGVKYQSSLGLELNQLIFDGSYLVGLQASKTYKELSTKALSRSKIETAVAVTKAYYSVLVSDERLSLLDANILRLKKNLNDTEAFFKNGFAEKIDVDRLQVLFNNLQTERENVIRLLALNLDVLKFQMGMPVEAQLYTTDDISKLQNDLISIRKDTVAYKSRIEYSLLETQKKLNELDLKRYKSQFLPSVGAFANASSSYQSNSFSTVFDNSFPTSLIGFRISLPIINGGQRLYRVRNAKLEVQKTDNNLYNLRNSINLEIVQSQTNYLNGVQSLNNQKRNMDLAKDVLRVTRIKYEQGVGSNLEVTSAETLLKEAENNYINSLYDQVINKVNLDKALGKINY